MTQKRRRRLRELIIPGEVRIVFWRTLRRNEPVACEFQHGEVVRVEPARDTLTRLFRVEPEQREGL